MSRAGAVRRWMYRSGRPNRVGALLNRVDRTLASAGLWPSRLVTLEVRGRRSGRLVSLPVVVAEYGRALFVAARPARGLGCPTCGPREDKRCSPWRPGNGPPKRSPGLLHPDSRQYLQVAPGARAHIRGSEAPRESSNEIAAATPCSASPTLVDGPGRGSRHSPQPTLTGQVWYHFRMSRAVEPSPRSSSPFARSLPPGRLPRCAATVSDGFGPFGRGSPPVRASIGKGHVLSGVILSALSCKPIRGARVELWQSNAKGRYVRATSATVLADRSGRFRFEGPYPASYDGGSPHIHMRVVAPPTRSCSRGTSLPGARAGDRFGLCSCRRLCRNPFAVEAIDRGPIW